MKGGYKIIDFKGVSLSSTPAVIAEITNNLIFDYDKAVLLTNVKIGDEEMDDCFSTIINNDDGTIKLNCYGGYITIDGDDSEVSFTQEESATELSEKIGDLDDLETTDKDSVVDAINEVNGNIGDLTDLETTDKDSLVDAVNEIKGRILYSTFTTKVTTEVDANAIGGNRASINLSSTIDPNFKVGAICIPIFAAREQSQGRPVFASVRDKATMYISSGFALNNEDVIVQVMYVY